MPEPGGWDFENPVGIRFGWGRLSEIRDLAQGRCLLITSPGATRRGLTARLIAILGEASAVVYDNVEPNPTIASADAAISMFKGLRVDTIIGVGGGSVIDFAKILGVMLANPGVALRDALSEADPFSEGKSLRVIAVPTTAGTGSEVTPFATIWERAESRKHSLSSPSIFADVAILDPELTLTLPWESTLAPGLDALSQCFESIWNRNANPLTTALAMRGLSLVPAALRRLSDDLQSRDSRAAMLEASLLSGLAISRTRTALAHAMSYPLTAHFGVPHGLACSFSLPALLQFNLAADDGRLAAVASQYRCKNGEELVQLLVRLLVDLRVPRAFREYVPEYAAVYSLVDEMTVPDRAGNNMRDVDRDVVRRILDAASAWMCSQ